MPKITSSNAKGFILSYIIRIITSSFISLFLISLIISELFLKIDIDTKYISTASFFIIAFTVFFSSLISIWGMKHNIIAFSLLSQIPLTLYIIVNSIIRRENIWILTVKIILIVLFSIVAAILTARKKH